MKRLRIAVVTAIAAASIGVVAAPASACQRDVSGGCCEDALPNVLWRKLTGNDLFYCPW